MYTVDYFIKKFEAIPEEMWTVGTKGVDPENREKCALGHCGIDYYYNHNTESTALNLLFMAIGIAVIDVNDCQYNKIYQQPTPKQRILAALYDIKSNEAVKQVEEIISHPQEKQKTEFV